MAVDMETATIFTVGFANRIPTGALLLVSDRPMISDGIKTAESDKHVTQNFVKQHLEIGVEVLNNIKEKNYSVKHLIFLIEDEETNFLFSTFLLFIYFFFRVKKNKNSSVPPADTRVEWIKKTWDFGNITQGETVTHTFYFKNTGTQNLLIKNVETGCGCTTADYDKAPCSPRERRKNRNCLQL